MTKGDHEKSSITPPGAVAMGTTGLVASVHVSILNFAVLRRRTMLTDLKMIPDSHFGMSGTIKDHRPVYSVVIAGFLSGFFDPSRIASLGAVFCKVMDIIICFGAKVWVLLTVCCAMKRQTAAQKDHNPH